MVHRRSDTLRLIETMTGRISGETIMAPKGQIPTRINLSGKRTETCKKTVQKQSEKMRVFVFCKGQIRRFGFFHCKQHLSCIIALLT